MVTNLKKKILIVLIAATINPAYCTGLLLARRVLKTLEMDEEYEGNIEVYGLFILLL